MKRTIEVKITGLDLVEKIKDDTTVTVAKITCKGTGDGDRTRLAFYVVPKDLAKYPIGTIGEISFEVRQMSMDLEGDGESATEAEPAGRTRRSARSAVEAH